MAVFKLACKVTVSAFTEVEAYTLEAAMALAASRDVVLADVGSGAQPEDAWVIEEADGTPFDIRAEK